MATNNKIKPRTIQRSTILIYDQKDILKALGIPIIPGEFIYVYCDGTNAVKIERYQPSEE